MNIASCFPRLRSSLACLGFLTAITAFTAQASAGGGAGRTPDAYHKITFARLVLRIKGTTDIAVSSDDLRVHFIEEMRASGYPAVGAENIVFDKDNSNGARFAVGGTVHELDCKYDEEKDVRNCHVGVAWEIMDNESGDVVYRVITRHAARYRDPKTTGNTLLNGAFRSLLARPALLRILRKEAPSTASSSFEHASFKRCPASSRTMPGSSDKVLDATVLVEAGTALGSGVLISPDGFVLTAAHVVSSGTPLKVQLPDGTRLKAFAVRTDRHSDVALIKLRSEEEVPCLAHRADELKTGDEIYAIGSPLAKELAFSLSRGIVSAVRDRDGVSLIQTDASVNRGNSGGPMIDKDGRWAAITSWKAVGSGVEGIAFGVTVKSAFDALSIGPGDDTDESLKTAQAPSRRTYPAPVDDTPDMPALPPEETEQKKEARRTDGAVSLETLGWVGGSVGVAAFILPFSGETEDTARTAGVFLVAGGIGAIVTSYLLPRQKPSARRSDVAFSAGVGPRSLTLGVTY